MSTRKTKVLVVDDESGITRMIKLNLEKTGDYEVWTVNEGCRAIEAARLFKPDIIFLDVMLPDLQGDRIAEQLREDEELKDIKRVFMTAIVTRDETADGGNEIGGNHFLAKPVKTRDIIRMIEKLL
ncbi:MAG TPA: response regulator [Gammaproteobacteria bacterium]|nr:response regulator [Gammaproteobacteria bacterium]